MGVALCGREGTEWWVTLRRERERRRRRWLVVVVVVEGRRKEFVSSSRVRRDERNALPSFMFLCRFQEEVECDRFVLSTERHKKNSLKTKGKGEDKTERDWTSKRLSSTLLSQLHLSSLPSLVSPCSEHGHLSSHLPQRLPPFSSSRSCHHRIRHRNG